MSVKLTDPLTFLENLLSRKGRSDLYGIYLSGVSIIASPTENYDYDFSEDAFLSEVDNTFKSDAAEWNQVLIDILRQREEIVHPISFLRNREPNTVYFIVENNTISAMVFIPTTTLDCFASEVTFYQVLLKEICRFTKKTPGTLRFTLGSVSMDWEETVQRGYAEEVDVGF